MFKQLKKQPNLAGVASGGIANGRIPTIGTLYAILLKINGTVAQTITEIGDTNKNLITVRADGEIIIEATPTFLFMLQKYYGDAIGDGNVATADDCILPIRFDRYHLPTDSERSLYGLGLADVGALTVDIQIGTLATITSIEMFALMTPENRRMGQHIRLNRFPNSFASTGLQEISTLPKGGVDEGYAALHIEENAGTLQSVTVKKGGYVIYDQVNELLNDCELAHNYRTPQSGFFHVAFDSTRDLTGFVPMAKVKDWRQELMWITAAPTTFSIYAERIFGLNVKE